MKVPAEILQALREAVTDGPRLVLAGPRMNGKTYQRVNEVLEAAGGRWARTAEAHLFPLDAAKAIAPVLASGQVVTLREKRNQAQYFPTPAPVVGQLIDLAVIRPGMEVLEPSAGSGAIAAAARQGGVVDCFEQDPGYAAVLAETGAVRSVQVTDFLSVPAHPRYDRVVMNPPFTKGADITHVQHALRFLKPGGLLIAVMSWAVTEQNCRTAKFRALAEARGATVEAVPEKAFSESGTNIPTVIVRIPYARPADATPIIWPQRIMPEETEVQAQDPLVIANEIRASLRDALREFDAVAASLAKSALQTPAACQADVLELPARGNGQLAFDEPDEASA